MSDEANPDDINTLMERCETARRKCEDSCGRLLNDFVICYSAQIPGDQEWEPWMLWYVGISEPDQGKHTATGETLTDALTAWLDDYEHQWDAPPGDP